METKDSKEMVRAFLTMNTKENPLKKNGLTREQKLLEGLKNYEKIKDHKFILQ